DNETGAHVVRMSHYARIVALELGFGDAEAEELLHAAPMHDIGKIGIPDAILSKPGRLTPEEWVIMRQHTVIGARILGEHPSGMLKLAATIALNHPGGWDARGYPTGLAGAEMPVVARLVAIADVFEALTSVRPDKRAWSVGDAVAFMRDESGRHFDPEVVTAFLDSLPRILAVKDQWADTEADLMGAADKANVTAA